MGVTGVKGISPKTLEGFEAIERLAEAEASAQEH